MTKKILRNGRCDDVTRESVISALSMFAFPMLWLAVGCTALFFDVFPEILVEDARSGLYVVLVGSVFWLFWISVCHFGWYVWKHDRRYYLADLPDFYIKAETPWLAFSLFAGLPFLLVSRIFMNQQRFRQWDEDERNTRQIWDQVRLYAGPTFETKAELEEFTAQQREGFREFCLNQRSRYGWSVNTEVVVGVCKAVKSEVQPIPNPEQIARDANELFDSLLKRADIIQIRTDVFIGEDRCLELYVRARPYSQTSEETFDGGDYLIRLYDNQCIMQIMRSGVSANGRAQWSELDRAQWQTFADYIKGQIIATTDPSYNRNYSTMCWLNDAPESGDVLTMVLHIVNAINEPRLRIVKEDELQYCYRKAVDCYYDTSGLKFYAQRDR